MKKVMTVLATAAILTSCGNLEFENVYSEYQKVRDDKDNKKENTEFVIFNDRFQKGKETK